MMNISSRALAIWGFTILDPFNANDDLGEEPATQWLESRRS